MGLILSQSDYFGSSLRSRFAPQTLAPASHIALSLGSLKPRSNPFARLGAWTAAVEGLFR
ncbi:hypothetical protein EFP84_18700 [Leptospira kmetyi]|uniref:Uncharacterized protein n=1 Tax=Leptospira kmetyi TaxID=408139 RepID=A0AAD0UU01_9LEPT|nr:hypothetical protein EFP84_18700 [Leptospira kmetyi]